MKFQAGQSTPGQDSERKALQSKAYRERPEVAAKRRARRAAEKMRMRERQASETQEQHEARRAKERVWERKREAARTNEERKAKNAYRKQWYEALPAEKKLEMHRIERCRKLGITPEALDAMKAKQGNRCAICSMELPPIGLPPGSGFGKLAEHVDHDHETGLVRGVLCGRCNTALGALGDNEAGIVRALDYLRAATGPVEPDWF